MNNILPVPKDKFFEMRFHSIGGQGAYTVGQMIATIAAKKTDIKASVFASYGSEKKGAPVSVFIRMLESEKKIENFSAVKNPNVVAVFHEKLLLTIDVLNGIEEDGYIIVNTDLTPKELKEMYNLNIKRIITVDAVKYALQSEAKLNTVMFGAIMKTIEFINEEEGIKEIEDKLSYKYPQLVKGNQEAYKLGLDNLIIEDFTKEVETKANKIKKMDLGYENQFEGGIIKGANTYKVNRSISREGKLPLFNKEECINCTKCDMTCPDDCFVWEEVEGRRGRMEMVLKGIDYDLCKGCLRCVHICPTEALKEEVETREVAQKNTVKKY